MRIERRQSFRATVEKVVYIHLEPDNGGIVLNLSDGGFCFHAAAPIHQTGQVTFWLSMQAKDRIQGCGELVWTDEKKKTGALRLNLSDEQRRLFRNWIEQPPQPIHVKFPRVPAAPPEPGATPAVLLASVEAPASASPPIAPRSTRRLAGPGLFSVFNLDSVGIFISGFALTLALFLPYGPRLARAFYKWGVGTIGLSAPQNGFPAIVEAGSDLGPSPVPPAVTPQSLAKLAAEIAKLDDEPQASDSGASERAADAVSMGAALPLGAADSLPLSSPPAPVLTAAANSADADPPSSLASSGSDVQDAGLQTADSISLKYLDAGSFKNFLSADDTTDTLSHLGFRAIIVHKGILWMSSYHVLVGPFDNGNEVEAAREKLEARGITPRPAKP